MPYPRNVETALKVESIIRDHGAIPATIGCIEGQLQVGMTSHEIETLANSKAATKISRRDLAVVAARGLTGGTTIAGTIVLAHMAGIKVFATGVRKVREAGLILGNGRCPSWRRVVYVH
jgi:pseudouridylate synthase